MVEIKDNNGEKQPVYATDDTVMVQDPTKAEGVITLKQRLTSTPYGAYVPISKASYNAGVSAGTLLNDKIYLVEEN